ncbi:MAG TPA: hypothetical protein VG817_09330 [Gemmatimonadales bacterium]|nr:hypothetical protein [Gemmatimonadales bacterium]
MMSIRSRAGWTLILLGLAAARLQAQGPATMEQERWEIADGDVGYCVQFLLDPKEALKEMQVGYRPVSASATDAIHPAIKRAISDEPKFADWVPSEICTWFVGSVTTGNRKYERGDKNAPLAITWWGVAASQGEGAWDGRYWLRMMGANSYPLVRLMQVAKLPMEKVTINAESIRGNDLDREYFIKFNRATIQLTGRFTPDSTEATAAPRKFIGVMPGPLQTMWTSDFALNLDEKGTMSGSLQIFGGRGMAKELRESPIRLISSAMHGGSGAIQFQRWSTKTR